jgi:hypothetical protein
MNLLAELKRLQGKAIKQYAIERLFPTALSDDQARRDLKLLLAQRS